MFHNSISKLSLIQKINTQNRRNLFMDLLPAPIEAHTFVHRHLYKMYFGDSYQIRVVITLLGRFESRN